MERETIKHESFGQIRFSRINSNGTDFYGSELPQDSYIQLEVTGSETQRDLSREWHHPTDTKLKLRLSSAQFAELITSLNVGTGVPCTLEFMDGKRVVDLLKHESRKEFVHRKFKDRMKAFGDTIREKQQQAKELVKKKALSKQDIHELQTQLDWLTGEVERNIPFFIECFQETTDQVVSEAKMEVENAIMHKITTLGFGALHNQNKLLK